MLHAEGSGPEQVNPTEISANTMRAPVFTSLPCSVASDHSSALPAQAHGPFWLRLLKNSVERMVAA
jgi:hypothetical protein